jgi:hypothetical protein
MVRVWICAAQKRISGRQQGAVSVTKDAGCSVKEEENPRGLEASYQQNKAEQS